MSETQLRLTANLGVAKDNVGFAQDALTAGDFGRAARFMGVAVAALTISATDVVDLAPAPTATQTAFDNARLGIGE